MITLAFYFSIVPQRLIDKTGRLSL